VSASTTSSTVASLGGKFLTFALAAEEYGLPILAVREILACPAITPVPRAPAHIRGVINLRGQVITVMDLRVRFELPAGEKTDQTCIIVVETRSAGKKTSTGILVDRVCEVLEIPSGNIEPPPAWGATNNDYLLGLGKVGAAVKILLNAAVVVGTNNSTEQAQAA
jgi:purine-binding chemotaxis protein CheW